MDAPSHYDNQFLCSYNLRNCFQLLLWDVLLFETIRVQICQTANYTKM